MGNPKSIGRGGRTPALALRLPPRSRLLDIMLLIILIIQLL
jgi:hypothetical protein